MLTDARVPAKTGYPAATGYESTGGKRPNERKTVRGADPDEKRRTEGANAVRGTGRGAGLKSLSCRFSTPAQYFLTLPPAVVWMLETIG